MLLPGGCLPFPAAQPPTDLCDQRFGHRATLRLAGQFRHEALLADESQAPLLVDADLDPHRRLGNLPVDDAVGADLEDEGASKQLVSCFTARLVVFGGMMRQISHVAFMEGHVVCWSWNRPVPSEKRPV